MNSMNFAYQKIAKFPTCQFGKNTGQNLTKLYVDVNTNF